MSVLSIIFVLWLVQVTAATGLRMFLALLLDFTTISTRRYLLLCTPLIGTPYAIYLIFRYVILETLAKR